MTTNFFLVVNDGGTVRAVKNRPDLKWNEISVAVKLDLPSQLFRKPQLSATITVPETSVSAPEIEAGIADNIKEAIETATGYEVKLTLELPS